MIRRLLALRWRVLPLAVAVVVLCIPFVNSSLNHRHAVQAAAAAESRLGSPAPVKNLQGLPDRIIIPDLSIDLPVVGQSYSAASKTWPVSVTDANYASNTAPINNTHGESLIYGHSTRSVFGPLLNLKLAAIAYVYTANGHVFKYSYAGSQDVTPYKLSIFQDMASAPAGLKLITCDGQYFQYRRLMSFKLLQAS